MSNKKIEKRKRKEKEKKQKKVKAQLLENVTEHYFSARVCQFKKDTKGMIYHLKKVINIKPDEEDALMMVAEALFNSKDYAEAAYYLQRMKDLDIDWPFLDFYLGLSYFFSGIRIDQALKSLTEFIEKTAKERKKQFVERRENARYYCEKIRQDKERESAVESLRKIKESLAEKPKERTKSAEKGGSPEEKRESVTREERHQVDITFSFSPADLILERIEKNYVEQKDLYDLRLEFHHLSLLRGYDELLCLDTLHNVDHYWYQVETVKRVLKYYRGRVLLADEVGLGKTIEACMLIKEYLLRGMIKRVLVLTPTSLVSQWHEELASKFGLDFVTAEREDLQADDSFWEAHPLIIASINVAKSKKNFKEVTSIEHDLVVVDEAHHMRNCSTLNWKLVNALKKRFVFLISATPVQNNLIELYNLITLLKPGFLKTQGEFRKMYVAPGKTKMPKNADSLRQLLKEVMIRNTRSLIDVRLPSRFATTVAVTLSPSEKKVYDSVSSLVRGWFVEGLNWFTLVNLQRRAGSSLEALKEGLERISEKGDGFEGHATKMLEMISDLSLSEKKKRFFELISRKPGEKKIIFTHYTKTLDSLGDFLKKEGIPFTFFRGDMTNAQKDKAITDFRDEVEVLLSTEVGGEGRNIQFCNTILNYDLPWNPMRIEQRIGRIHRIGQTRDVYIFNFCLKGSIEEYILDILHKKINMFELVVGEIDNILGNLDEESEFSDLVMDIWVKSKTDEELERNFERLAAKMLEAKKGYQESKVLDETLLSADYVA